MTTLCVVCLISVLRNAVNYQLIKKILIKFIKYRIKKCLVQGDSTLPLALSQLASDNVIQFQ